MKRITYYIAIILLFATSCTEDQATNNDSIFTPSDKEEEQDSTTIEPEIPITGEVDGQIVVFENVDFGTGYYYFETTIIGDNLTGNLEIRLDEPDGDLIGTCRSLSERAEAREGKIDTSIRDCKGMHTVYLIWLGEDPLQGMKQPRFIAGRPLSI